MGSYAWRKCSKPAHTMSAQRPWEKGSGSSALLPAAVPKSLSFKQAEGTVKPQTPKETQPKRTHDRL